jgi:outer membrane protein
MKKISILSAVLSVPFFANALELEFSVGPIQQKPSGYVSYKAQNDTDKIDVKSDANLGDKTNPWVKLKLEHPIPLIPNIKLSYMPMKFSGSGVLIRDIKWGDYTYKANADYNLSVKLDRLDTTLYYNLPFIKTVTAGVLDVEFGLNVRTLFFDGKLNGTDKTTGQKVSESKSITIPVPMGHLATEIKPVPYFSVLGTINYIGYNKNTYYDYTLSGRLYAGSLLPLGKLKPFLEAGYREEKLKIDESSVKTDLKVKGGYALVGLQF